MNSDFDILEFLSIIENDKKEMIQEDLTEDTISLDEDIYKINLDEEDKIEINNDDRKISVTGLLEIKDNKLKLVLNEDGMNNELILRYNKQLSIYSELYETGLEEINNINNSLYERTKNNYNYKLKKLKSELEYDNNQKVKRLILEHQNNIKYIETDNELKYKNKIDILEDKLKNLKETLTEKHEIEIIKLNNVIENYDQVNKIKLKNEIEKNIKLENEVLELKQEKELLYSLTKVKPNQTKGKEGELTVYKYLYDKLNLDNENYIEDVSKDQRFSSDLYLKYKKLNCVIEVKNIETNIYDKDIKMFETKYICDERYNCGIFISLLSDYSLSTNRFDFNLLIIENKPVIYLSFVNNNLDKIIFALKILNYMLDNNNNDNDSIWQLLKLQVSNYANIKKDALNATKSLQSLLKTVDNNKRIIESFIKSEYNDDDLINENNENLDYRITSDELNCIQCAYCNIKPYAKKSNGITHFITHLKNKHFIVKTKDELEL